MYMHLLKMHSTNVILVLFAVFSCICQAANIGETRQSFTLSYDGGYENILCAIDSEIPEDTQLLQKIQDAITSTSKSMFNASSGQVYINSVTIYIPSTWTANSGWAEPGNDQSVNTARVIIAKSNLAHRDTPYTHQPGLCGVEGDYVHITPEYLNNTEQHSLIKNERIFRVMTQLFLGVYEEEALVSDTITPKFYTYAHRYYPTRSPSAIEGLISDKTTNNGGCEEHNHLPTDACQFDVTSTSTGPAWSIDGGQPNTIDGCVVDRFHDILSPSRQNRICGMSASDSVSIHNDFTVDYVSRRRNDFSLPSPTFNIVQKKLPPTPAPPTSTTTTQGSVVINTQVQTTRTQEECDPHVVCLTTDSSGSMSTANRITEVASAVTKLIKSHLPKGSVVAVTHFSSNAITLSPMTEITSDSIRNMLVANLPRVASGGTNIDAGLELCRQHLLNYAGANEVSKTKILLLSDGQASIGSLNHLTDLGITVDTIAYSQAASPVLISIAEQTGGLAYYTGDRAASIDLQEALLATIQQDCDDAIVLLVNKQVTIPPGVTSLTESLYIDSTLGDDTKIVVTYTSGVEMKVETPMNNKVTIIPDPTLKTITAQIEGSVTGNVSYTLSRVQTQTSAPEVTTVTITSNPNQEEDSIRYKIRKSTDAITFTPTSQVDLYVDIFKGMTSVQRMEVKVTVTTPAETKVELMLYDNGAGIDSIEHDGTYSGSFAAAQMNRDGFYSVKVELSGEAYLPYLDDSLIYNYTSIGQIQRTFSGGLLRVIGWRSNTADSLPPSRIRDLKLESIYGTSGYEEFEFQFTSPVFGHGISNMNLELEAVIAAHLAGPFVPVHPSRGRTSNPSGDQTFELLTFNASSIAQALGSKISHTHYLKVRTTDASGNKADWSNIASASFVSESFANSSTLTVSYQEIYRTSGDICTIALQITDPRIRRRLVFKSDYNVDCQVVTLGLDDTSTPYTLARLGYHSLLGTRDPGYMDWDRPTDADVEIKCNEDNTLAVIWPTDVTYPGDVTKLSDDLEQRLNARFMITGVFTSLFFLKSNPPTYALPTKHSSGGFLRAELASFCVDNMMYDEYTDSCQ